MKVLTKKELAQRLQCNEKTVMYYVSSKQIPHIKIGKEVRFQEDSIMSWLNEREEKPQFDLTEMI